MLGNYKGKSGVLALANLLFVYYISTGINYYLMKKVLGAILILILISSCNRNISPYEAANGKARCGKWVK